MGKFKVGDRVRFVMDYGYAKKGDEGTIVSFLAEDGAVVTHKTVNHSCNFSRIELVPVASAEWQPKVGDRVVVTDNITPGGSPIKKYEVGKEYTVTSTCKDSAGGHAVMLLGHHQYLRSDQFAAPTPLTITAGRYYKTRDGRKVGPMEDYGAAPGEDLSIAQVDGNSKLFNRDGTHHFKDRNIDLIAEWVDEPTVIASNDNAAPAKFKVGDRIVSAEDGPTKGLFGVIIGDDKSEAQYIVRFEGFDDGHGTNDNEWWLRAEEAQFPALFTTTPRHRRPHRKRRRPSKYTARCTRQPGSGHYRGQPPRATASRPGVRRFRSCG
ncbi:hypothetical protein A4U53_031055 [Rhizobium ruizarguesonis]|uniref:Uncharacterized protein n=1 Tax=Rhizobium ruizarguesonis TaxID=2081791 RepID=A0ACD5EMP1_9HYPH